MNECKPLVVGSVVRDAEVSPQRRGRGGGAGRHRRRPRVHRATVLHQRAVERDGRRVHLVGPFYPNTTPRLGVPGGAC